MEDPQALKNIAFELDRVLADSSEQKIHEFLEGHLELFGFLQRDGFTKSKLRLADSFIPDFVVIGLEPYSNDPRPHVTFIEIERANETLFTSKGDPTAFLTHAVKQTQDWKRWVTDNRSFLHTTLHRLIVHEASPKAAKERDWRGDNIERGIARGFHDRYLVIAGRRGQMSIENRLALAQMNHDLLDIRIITYDVLLERIFRELDYIYGNGTWHDLSRS